LRDSACNEAARRSRKPVGLSAEPGRIIVAVCHSCQTLGINGPTSTKSQTQNHKHQITNKSQVPNDKHQTARGQSCPANQTSGLRKTIVRGPRRRRRSDPASGASSFRSLEFWCLVFVWNLLLEVWSFAGAASCHPQPTAPCRPVGPAACMVWQRAYYKQAGFLLRSGLGRARPATCSLKRTGRHPASPRAWRGKTGYLLAEANRPLPCFALGLAGQDRLPAR